MVGASNQVPKVTYACHYWGAHQRTLSFSYYVNSGLQQTFNKLQVVPLICTLQSSLLLDIILIMHVCLSIARIHTVETDNGRHLKFLLWSCAACKL